MKTYCCTLPIILFLSFICVSRSDEPEPPCVVSLIDTYRDQVEINHSNLGMCIVRGDGRYVFTARYHQNRLLSYRRDSQTGKLELLQGVEIDFPTALAASPDNSYLYVAGRIRESLQVYRLDPTTGVASLIQTLSGQSDAAPHLNGIFEMVVSPDGRNLYAVNSDHRCLLVFDRNAQSGHVTLRQVLQDNDATQLRPGTNVPQTERIPDAIITDGLYRARGIAIAPDGAYVYTAAYSDKAVGIFARDAEAGLLEFIDAVKEPKKFPVFGLTFVADVEVSPDGRSLYAATIAGRLVAFARNPETGGLRWLETFDNRLGDVSGMDYAECVKVAPDGKDVFVASSGAPPGGSGIARFRRDDKTGRLTWLGTVVDGQCGCTTLTGSRWLALSPDGQHLYNSSIEHSVGAFAIPSFEAIKK